MCSSRSDSGGSPVPDTDLRESETIEFKESWGEAALESVAAFANHNGGSVWLGIRDDGTTKGADDGDSTIQKISDQAVDRLGLRPSIQARTRDGKPVLEIIVQPSDDLVTCRGRYLTRVGSTNREMTPEQVVRHLLQRSGTTWDGLAVPRDTPAGLIKREAVRTFLALAHARLPGLQADESIDRVLANLDLTIEDHPRRAAVLLFGEPQRLFPAARVRVARFRAGQIIGEFESVGNLFEQLDRTLAALRNFLEVRQEIKTTGSTLADLQRREVWQYPLDALREAVVNALVHRDYGTLGDIQIRVLDSELTIWSPGGLTGGLTPADLAREGHVSRRRNEFLAGAFYLAGLVERWGTGTTRMITACLAAGLPPPEFEETQGGVRVTFRTDPWTPERLREMSLNNRQIAAVAAVRNHRAISGGEYQRLTGASKQTASRDLDALVRLGVFRREGSRGPAVRYVLSSVDLGTGATALANGNGLNRPTMGSE